MTPCIAYCRCSTLRQEKSIPEQKSAISTWAERNGYTILRWFADEGISGDEFDKRPDFQKMLAFCAAPAVPFEAVLVFDKSRFGRPDNPKQGTAAEYQIERHGKQIIYVASGRKSDGSIGSAFQDLAENAEAGEKLKSLSATIGRHQIENAKAGWSTGRKAPYGYDTLVVKRDGSPRWRVRYIGLGVKNHYRKDLLDPATGAIKEVLGPEAPLPKFEKTDRSRLVLGDPAQAAVVRDVFDRYIAGDGLKAIVRRLNKRAAPSPCGRQWYLTAIREMLTNPVYAGQAVSNRRTKAKFYQPSPDGVNLRAREHKGRVEHNAPEKWIRSAGSAGGDLDHPAIVSLEVFEKAQAIHKTRIRRTPDGRVIGGGGGKGAHSPYLLSHVAKCARCGSPYYGKRTRKGGSAIVSASYVCGAYFAKTTCRVGSVALSEIEPKLVEELRKFYFGVDSAEEIERMIRSELALEVTDHSGEIARLWRRDSELAAKADNWIECITPSTKQAIGAKLDAAKAEREKIAAEIARLEVAQAAQTDIGAAVREVQEIIGEFRPLFESNDPEGLKRVVRRFVNRVTIDYEAGKAVIEFRPLSSVCKVGADGSIDTQQFRAVAESASREITFRRPMRAARPAAVGGVG